jgi:hypothetical protein
MVRIARPAFAGLVSPCTNLHTSTHPKIHPNQHSVPLTDISHSEEFFRLKKVQGKKKRDAAAADTDRSVANAEAEAQGEEVHKDDGVGGGAAGGGDMLDQHKDDDVIF